MTTQPEALRLADELEKDPLVNRLGFVLVAAKYLRRLHAENEALRKDSERYRWIKERERVVVMRPDTGEPLDDAIDKSMVENHSLPYPKPRTTMKGSPK